MTELHIGDFPGWLTAISAVSVALGIVLAVVVTIDVKRRPQHMAVMNVVWPVTMLFGSVLAMWFYRRYARAGVERAGETPTWVSTATSTSHCGAGCTLGDLIAEFGIAAFPALAVAVGWTSLYDNRVYAAWIWDFVLAFTFGIAMQYFAIAPMRNESRRASLRDALKADTASITAWQVGMYGAMAVLQFAVLRHWLGGSASVLTPEFWFGMQIAMLAGFACSYPMNVLLIRRGVKEAM